MFDGILTLGMSMAWNTQDDLNKQRLEWHHNSSLVFIPGVFSVVGRGVAFDEFKFAGTMRKLFRRKL
jgi:hypothetical protein